MKHGNAELHCGGVLPTFGGRVQKSQGDLPHGDSHRPAAFGVGALKWSDVHLDAVVPFIQVRASTTKNGKAVTMRLHQDVIAALRDLKTRA